MKKILFLALVVMLGMQSVSAQRKDGNIRTPEEMVEKLDRKLNLTEEQEAQITVLYKDFFQQKLPREARKTAMQELDNKIAALLDAEQKKAFEQMIKERPQRKH